MFGAHKGAPTVSHITDVPKPLGNLGGVNHGVKRYRAKNVGAVETTKGII